MDCETFRAELDDLRSGRLDAEATSELRAHVAGCADCEAFAKRRGRPPRLVAAGFLGAFAASIATLIYTGLNVREPGPEADAEPARASVEAPEAPATDADADAEDEAVSPEVRRDGGAGPGPPRE